MLPAGILGITLFIWLGSEYLGILEPGAVMERLNALDRPAAAAAIAGLLIADVLLPVPSTPLMVLAGAVLGGPAGILLSVAGSMGSSVCAYALGRLAGRRVTARLIGPDSLIEMARWADAYGPWAFAFSRCLPMMAETAGVVAGTARVPLRGFLGWTLAGTVPTCVVYGVAGARAETAEQVMLLLAAGFAAAVLLLGHLRRRARRDAGRQTKVDDLST